MTERHPAVAAAVAAFAVIATSLAGAGPAGADPADPTPTYPVPPPPAPTDGAPAADQPLAAAPADPAAPPPPPAGPPGVPEIPNPTYGSGKSGGGVFGTLMDIWEQVKNPTFTAEELYGSGVAPTPPPGAGPAPALPPGYVSTNAPGSLPGGRPSRPATTLSMGRRRPGIRILPQRLRPFRVRSRRTNIVTTGPTGTIRTMSWRGYRPAALFSSGDFFMFGRGRPVGSPSVAGCPCCRSGLLCSARTARTRADGAFER
jgi:hypothetical protein